MTELIIRNGRCLNREDEHFEAKRADKGVSKSIWDSYSSFANTSGGTIVIGLSEADDGEGFVITGVRNAEGVRDELWSTLNNPQKVSVNVMMQDDLRVVEADGKGLIVLDVPPADRTLRPVYIGNVNSGTFKRHGSGDYHCNAEDIAAMYRDAAPRSRDSLTASTAEMEDLDTGSVESFKRAMSDRTGTIGGWTSEPDGEFLRLIGAARMEDGRLRPTFAGLMMFGRGNIIQMEVPGFVLDYREYPDDGDEWDLRRLSGMPDWSGNLFDFYSFVINRLPQVVGTGFSVPDGLTRADDTALLRAMREIVTNCIAHADYWGRRGVLIELRPGSLTCRNPGTFRVPIDEAEAGGVSDPRNEVLFRMLNYIGKAERAGSGVRNVFRICGELGLEPPSIEEGQRPDSVRVNLTFGGGRRDGAQDMIADLIRRDQRITMESISSATGMSRNRVSAELAIMKSQGRLARIGGPRGRWDLKW